MSAEAIRDLKERLANEPITIGIVGTIGSGKSTLAKVLSQELDINRVEENFPANPFLKDFYDNPAEFSFRSQVWFMRSAFDQLLTVKHRLSTGSSILDPANEMNQLFAKTHRDLGWMSFREFDLYENLSSTFAHISDLKKPDVFIWADASKDILIERIKERGRPYELKILKDFPNYLSALNQTIKFAARSGYINNVLYVNTGNIDYSDEVHIKGLIGVIKSKLN